MSHLIAIELEAETARRLLKYLQKLPGDTNLDLPDLIYAIEEAIDSDDA